MIVQATKSENEVKFNFYTYDPMGRDIIIAIYAGNVDAAWAKFDKIYGKDTPVDAVRTTSGELV